MGSIILSRQRATDYLFRVIQLSRVRVIEPYCTKLLRSPFPGGVNVCCSSKKKSLLVFFLDFVPVEIAGANPTR